MRSSIVEVTASRFLIAVAMGCAGLLSACVSPSSLPTQAGGAESTDLQAQPASAAGQLKATAPRVLSNDRVADVALNADAIRVLVWNVQKAGSDEWIGDFRTFAAESDLVLLQEAFLQGEFSHGIAGLLRWDLVEAWQRGDAPTGVLTGSIAEPLRVHALEQREPMLRTNKSALITEYRISGSAKTLLVANIHAINFTVDTRAFRRQLIAVADELDDHDGPVILCGDLNTWRAERHAIVDEIADALGLAEVAFDGPRKQFRSFVLDHVFYRDLELVSSSVRPVASSDHNPLQATFRYLTDAAMAVPAAGTGAAVVGEQ